MCIEKRQAHLVKLNQGGIVCIGRSTDINRTHNLIIKFRAKVLYMQPAQY
jgi:hypothetical protein